MKAIAISLIMLGSLFAWIFYAHSETSVYACSEVTKQDPIDVQKFCERERRGKWWMR